MSRYYWVLSAGTELLHLHGGEMVILHLPGGERTQVLPSSVLVGAYYVLHCVLYCTGHISEAVEYKAVQHVR